MPVLLRVLIINSLTTKNQEAHAYKWQAQLGANRHVGTQAQQKRSAKTEKHFFLIK